MHATYPHSGMVGWTCSICNGWVPSGHAHHCPGTTSPTKWINPPAPAPTPTDARIADALERIAAALEATREA